MKQFERRLGLTVKDLLKYCKQEIANGNGDKHILISQDDEGNGFHDLWYQFSDDLSDYCDGECSVIYDDYIKEHQDEFILLG